MIGILFGNMPTFSVPYDSPIKSGKDLVEGIKGGQLTASNSGTGGMWHVPQIIVANFLGGKFKAVPYNGGPQSALAAAKKEVDFTTSDISEALTLIRSKMLRPLFVFDDKPYVLDGVPYPAHYGLCPRNQEQTRCRKRLAGVGICQGHSR